MKEIIVLNRSSRQQSLPREHVTHTKLSAIVLVPATILLHLGQIRSHPETTTKPSLRTEVLPSMTLAHLVRRLSPEESQRDG